MTQIVLIGAGHIGTALHALLAPYNTVSSWDTIPGKVLEQKSLAEIIPNAQIIFLCVPTVAVRAAVEEIIQYLTPQTVVVSVSKGLEPNTKKSVDQVLSETLPAGQPHAFLGGPMLAKEINEGKSAMAVCGTHTRSAATLVKKAFIRSALRIEYSADIRGVALAGVLKNIYTLPMGMASGLDLGNNTIGWLAARGLNEMQTLMPMLGGKKKTLLTTAGLGDFIATATSPLSMNFKAGQEIARTGAATTRSEGIVTLPSLITMINSNTKKLPLLQCVAKIILEQQDPRKTLAEFIKNAR